jgi:hypothetical protein
VALAAEAREVAGREMGAVAGAGWVALAAEAREVAGSAAREGWVWVAAGLGGAVGWVAAGLGGAVGSAGSAGLAARGAALAAAVGWAVAMWEW